MTFAVDKFPLHLPAAEAYVAWANRQTYTPLPWEQLSDEQHQAWMAAALAAITWMDMDRIDTEGE